MALCTYTIVLCCKEALRVFLYYICACIFLILQSVYIILLSKQNSVALLHARALACACLVGLALRVLLLVELLSTVLTFHCTVSRLEVPAPGVTSVLCSEGASASSYEPVKFIKGK